MKVKLFAAHPGEIESKVNAFLEQNPGIKANNVALTGQGVWLTALMLFEEADPKAEPEMLKE